MAEPDYVVCVDCETPCYVFEWEGSKLIEAVCTVCGNDDPEQFMLPEEFDELTGA
jgi:hypothetical protein